MKNLHIAIVNQTNPAHVHPTLALVETFSRRGFRVTFVSSERYAAEVTRLGGEMVLSPRFEFPFNQKNDLGAPLSQQYCADPIDLATRTLTAVSPFYEQNVPDLILFDSSALAGLVLAERLNVPAIRTTPGLIYEQENLAHASFTAEFRKFMTDFSARVDAFYRQHGIERKNELFIGREPAIHFYLQELRLFPLADNRRDRFYAPRCAAERPFLEKSQSRDPAGKRAVLISASTVYDQDSTYYTTCAAALSELQLRCVLAIGANIDVSSLGKLPDDCVVVQGTPQVTLMPHVDIIVCLGGMTTLMESLYHGLPMVMLTHGKPNAEVYADNIAAHGLGIHLKGPLPDAASIRNAVAEVLADEALNARVQQAQRRVRDGAGAEEVANWIEHQLELSRAVPPRSS